MSFNTVSKKLTVYILLLISKHVYIQSNIYLMLIVANFSDMERGQVADVTKLGITESYQVKRQVLISGAEAAEMIMRVDNIIRAAPRQRAPDHRHH